MTGESVKKSGDPSVYLEEIFVGFSCLFVLFPPFTVDQVGIEVQETDETPNRHGVSPRHPKVWLLNQYSFVSLGPHTKRSDKCKCSCKSVVTEARKEARLRSVKGILSF